MDALYLSSLIALSASVVFALSNHVQHVALDHMDVRNGTLVNVATSAVMMWLLSPLFLTPEALGNEAILWFALAGLIVPSLSMTFHSLSVRMIGPALTAGLASTSPVFAMVLAVAVLGEVLSARILTGTAIVVGSIAFIALRSRGAGANWPLWAVAIPLGAALTRGLSHNVIKIGLGGLDSPMTAALVAATTSLLVLAIVHVASRRRLAPLGRGYFWFGLCGVLNGLGLVGLNAALALGEVIVVAPLVATTPAFTLIMGWLFFRREVVRLPVIVAIGCIFAGCLLIITR
jgi:drug/metabolite transporter (DMT)-like permease